MNDAVVPEIESIAVKDERKNALLFDLWVGGKWVGSRRTIEQCEDELTRLCGVPIHATYGSAW
jgi:hypothetical protein